MQVLDGPAEERLGAEIQLVVEGDEQAGAEGEERARDTLREDEVVDFVDGAGDQRDDEKSPAPFARTLVVAGGLGLAEGCGGRWAERLEGRMAELLGEAGAPDESSWYVRREIADVQPRCPVTEHCLAEGRPAG